MSAETSFVEELHAQIVEEHINLRGVGRHFAQYQFVAQTQNLDGYGLEYFNAKVSILLS